MRVSQQMEAFHEPVVSTEWMRKDPSPCPLPIGWGEGWFVADGEFVRDWSVPRVCWIRTEPQLAPGPTTSVISSTNWKNVPPLPSRCDGASARRVGRGEGGV